MEEGINNEARGKLSVAPVLGPGSRCSQLAAAFCLVKTIICQAGILLRLACYYSHFSPISSTFDIAKPEHFIKKIFPAGRPVIHFSQTFTRL